MRHKRNRHKLSHDSAHRKALMKNLSRQLIEHERIQTSQAKAKAVKPQVERMITIAKRGMLWASDSRYEPTPNLVSPVYPRR